MAVHRELAHAGNGDVNKVVPKGLVITVIDDDESVREALPDLLRELGFSVETFASAEAFLASAEAPAPNVLLIDVAMPGMSGPDLQQHLRVAGSAVPIIFMTAHRNDSIRQRVLDAGAVACLFKPFREADLVAALDRALGAAPPS
jgi:FixJ family two-component response regulator